MAPCIIQTHKHCATQPTLIAVFYHSGSYRFAAKKRVEVVFIVTYRLVLLDFALSITYLPRSLVLTMHTIYFLYNSVCPTVATLPSRRPSDTRLFLPLLPMHELWTVSRNKVVYACLMLVALMFRSSVPDPRPLVRVCLIPVALVRVCLIPVALVIRVCLIPVALVCVPDPRRPRSTNASFVWMTLDWKSFTLCTCRSCAVFAINQ